MEGNRKLLTIGELSKMTKLPIRTLHYYDEIGLFKPTKIDVQTNYRYYSESQIHHLDLIKSLKFIGTSLKDIKYAQSLTPEELVQFLSEQEQVVERKIRAMQEAHHTLLKTKKHLEEQIEIPVLEEVYFSEIASAQRILVIKTQEATVNYIPEKYFSSLTETVEREGSVMNSRYGGIYPLKPYATINDFYYTHIFTPLVTERYLEQLNKDVDVFVIEKGRYVSIAFMHSEAKYVECYEKLFEYVKHYPEPVYEQVYETFMPTNFSPYQEAQFIVELKIQIK